MHLDSHSDSDSDLDLDSYSDLNILLTSHCGNVTFIGLSFSERAFICQFSLCCCCFAFIAKTFRLLFMAFIVLFIQLVMPFVSQGSDVLRVRVHFGAICICLGRSLCRLFGARFARLLPRFTHIPQRLLNAPWRLSKRLSVEWLWVLEVVSIIDAPCPFSKRFLRLLLAFLLSFSVPAYPLQSQILNNNQVLFGYNFMPNNKFDYAQRAWYESESERCTLCVCVYLTGERWIGANECYGADRIFWELAINTKNKAFY